MNLNAGKMAAGLVEEILEVIHKYDESMYLPTVLGVLELVKMQLIEDHQEDDEE
jgi:hypothetical protein